MENENQTWKYGRETIHPNYSTCFAFSHSLGLDVDLYVENETCGQSLHLFLLIFHKFVCFVTKNLKYDIYGNSGQNLVLTKIDIKGRRAASAGWRELNELLEEKIPWYSEFPFLSKHLKLLVFRIPYYIQTSKSPFRAVCLSSWWVPFLFTQKGIQLSLGPTCTWEDAV